MRIIKDKIESLHSNLFTNKSGYDELESLLYSSRSSENSIKIYKIKENEKIIHENKSITQIKKNKIK